MAHFCEKRALRLIRCFRSFTGSVQFFFSTLALGHIVGNANLANDPTILIMQGRGGNLDI